MTPRVLVYHEGFYRASGGVESHVRNLVDHLPYEFDVVADDHGRELNHRPDRADVRVTRIGPRNTTTSPRGLALNARAMFPARAFRDWVRWRRTRRFLRVHSWDLAHFHGMGIGSALFRTLMMIHAAERLRPLPTALNPRIPRLLTVHALYRGSDPSIRSIQTGFMRAAFQRIICVDRDLVARVREMLATSEVPVEFIPNSIDTTRFHPLTRQRSEELIVGFVGRLEASRGIDHLARAMSDAPAGVRFQVICSASEREFRRSGAPLLRDNVDVHLNVPSEAMAEYYNRIDVLYNPVLVPGISRATLEAMACGRPAIMFGADSRYPLEDGVTGFLVGTRHEDIRSLLVRLVREREVLDELGRRARERVEREFSNEVILPRIHRIYRELIDGRSIP